MSHVKTDHERGYIGTWMRRERKALGWTTEAVVAHLQDDLGIETNVSSIRVWEAGPENHRPGAVVMAALVRLYGSEPVELEPEELPRDAVAEAVDRLTEAVERLPAMLIAVLAEARERDAIE